MTGREKMMNDLIDNKSVLYKQLTDNNCPSFYGLKLSKKCEIISCEECWKEALESEVEE